MMKKLLLILLIFAVSIFATSSFAAETELEPSAALGGSYQQVAQLLPPAEARKFIREYEKKQTKIKRNDVEIRMMKAAMKNQVKEIKARVKHLQRQGGGGLTAGDMENMQAALTRVEQAKVMLNATSGVLLGEVVQLKDARKARDFTGVLQNMNDIISIQDKRIKALNEINKNLGALKKTLG